MAKLIYLTIMSLDGYIEDPAGNFGWAEPDEEVHAFVNDLMRPVGTYLYGRRMYETMVYWEGVHSLDERGGVTGDFARIWQAADKLVYSTTIQPPLSNKTRVFRSFEPEQIRVLKGQGARDLSIGGPHIAAQALDAGLVDEVQLLIVPVAVGGGKPAFPVTVPLKLNLLDHRRFAGGAVFLRYRVRLSTA